MLGFILPQLIIESIIRDGIQNVRNDLTIIDDVFAQLTRTYNNEKYGNAEIAKIKALIAKDLAVVFSYNQVDAKAPCFSIMVGEDPEHKPRAHLSDDYEPICEEIVDVDELEALIKVEDMIVTSYNPLTGKVLVDDSTDLSSIYKGYLFVDAADVEFEILGGINDAVGDKSFFIEKDQTVDFSDVTLIKSSLNRKEFEVKGVTSEVKLVIGVHTRDALTTIYLYELLKYFVLSRKRDIIKRGLYTISYSGSDFNRDSQYLGDQVYTRFFTVSGKADDTWRSDQVVLIDSIEVDAIAVE